MPPKVAVASVVNRCTASELPTLLQGLLPHSIQLFAGVSAPTLRNLLEAASDANDSQATRTILFLNLPKVHRAETIIGVVIDQLAEAANNLWPLWFGGEDFSELNDSALSDQYLPIKLATLTSRLPGLSTGWAEAAIRKMLRGHNPHMPSGAPDIEWPQLCHAVNPNGLIAVVTLDEWPSQSSLAVVHALEWLALNGNVAIAILCRELPPWVPPFDRLLYGAREVTPEALPLAARYDYAEGETDDALATEASPVIILLPSVHGRPHPMSLIEQRLSKMIEADAELMSKFVFNARIEDVSLKSPKVDLLWSQGRLVIECDGAEHRGRRAYRDDRHRDYELLCAGYAVVRIPNEEIIEDFAKALEKIRSVVRLRRPSNGG